jgi:hypothetical protein
MTVFYEKQDKQSEELISVETVRMGRQHGVLCEFLGQQTKFPTAMVDT